MYIFKYFKENPAYAHLRIKWALESDEDVRSKAKTLTGRNLKIHSIIINVHTCLNSVF